MSKTNLNFPEWKTWKGVSLAIIRAREPKESNKNVKGDWGRGQLYQTLNKHLLWARHLSKYFTNNNLFSLLIIICLMPTS